MNRAFGFTNIGEAQNGNIGSECRGEEHEVELVWSLKSSKIRVYWNKRNISNLIHQDVRSHTVNISWHTYTGELLQVVAHAEATPGATQYDLLVDGVSFYRMPSILEVGQQNPVVEASESSDLSDETNSILDEQEYRIRPTIVHSHQSEHLGSSGSELDSLQSLADRHPGDGMGYRLSMVGLSNGLAEVDELHSEVYSPMLESLRQRIVECLPQLEGMVSRSIIHTFFPDYVSQQSLDLLSSKSVSSEERDPQQIEVDALCEAYEWKRRDKSTDGVLTTPLERPFPISIPHRTRSAPATTSRTLVDPNDSELDYMQKLIDFIFIKVRNEDVSSDEGARILLGVAAVLRLDFASPLPMDTVILDNLDASISVDDLGAALGKYGDMEAVALSSRRPSFGFCRFMSEEGFRRFLDANDTGSLVLSGLRPQVMPLSENMYSSEIDPNARENNNNDERALSPTPSLSTTRGMPSIPHLMGAWTDDNPEGDTVDSFVISDDLMRVWTGDDVERQPLRPRVITPDQHCPELLQQKVSLGSPRSSITDFEDLDSPASTCSF